MLTRAKALPKRVAVGTKADPVMLEIFNNLFMSIAEQMGLTLQNTSVSVNIKERLDFSCAVFDAQGNLVGLRIRISGQSINAWSNPGAIVGGLIVGFEMMILPKKWFRGKRFGNTRTWMRLHIWLGLICLPVILVHAGFGFGGPLTTVTLILFLLYTAYLLARSLADELDEQAARYSAVYAIVAFLDIPIINMSVRWWRTLHPQPIVLRGMERPALPPEMLAVLLIAFLGIGALALWLGILRTEADWLAKRTAAARAAIDRREGA